MTMENGSFPKYPRYEREREYFAAGDLLTSATRLGFNKLLGP